VTNEVKILLARLLTIDRGILSDMERKGFDIEDTRLVRAEIERLKEILTEA